MTLSSPQTLSQHNNLSVCWARQYAAGFLAYGYNPPPEAQISPEGGISRSEYNLDDLIQVTTLPILEAFTVGTTRKEAKNRLAERIHEHFPGISQEALNQFLEPFQNNTKTWLYQQQETSEGGKTRKYYLATAIIKAHRCELNPLAYLPPTSGKVIIKAGWVYTGYQILFKIFPERDLSSFVTYSKERHERLSLLEIGQILDATFISGIRFSTRCYGNHPIPPQSPFLASSALSPFIRNLHETCKQLLDQMVFRNFLVDETADQLNTTENHPANNSFPSAPSTLSSRDIYTLGIKIQKSANDDMRRFFRLIENYTRSNIPVRFDDLMDEAYRIFHKIFQSNNNCNLPYSHYSLLMGGTGIGISTAIALLLGASLKKIEINTPLGRVIEILTLERPNRAIPVVSSDCSATSGYDVYQHYIDTAGHSTTGTPSEEICNSAARCEAFTTYAPNNIIYLLGNGYFDGPKFVNALHKLVSYFPDLASPSQLSSVLFVINSHITHSKIDYDDIKTYISQYEDSYLEQIISNIPQDLIEKFDPLKLPNIIKQWIHNEPSPEKDEFQEQINLLPNETKEYFETQINYRIQIFRVLKKLSKENFLFFDVKHPEFVQQIDTWESTHRTFSVDRFDINAFMIHDGGKAFTSMISIIVMYFNNLQLENTKWHESMLKILIDLDDLKCELKKYQDFYRTIAMIIQKFNLFTVVSTEEREAYLKFCASFSNNLKF